MINQEQLDRATELSIDHNMSMAEALSLIIQNERNEILKKAFVISDSDEYPTGLEAIAIALGFENKDRRN